MLTATLCLICSCLSTSGPLSANHTGVSGQWGVSGEGVVSEVRKHRLCRHGNSKPWLYKGLKKKRQSVAIY